MEPQGIRLNTNEKYYIRFEYKGTLTSYVSVLRIDADGKTTLVSRAWERGIVLSEMMPSILLATSPEPLEGITIGWPESVPRHGSVEEAFIFIITSEEIDEGYLQTLTLQDYFVAHALARGPKTTARRAVIPYDVARIRYHLRTPAVGHGDDQTRAAQQEEGEDDPVQQPLTAAELPLPEETKEWKGLTSYLQERAAASKRLLDAGIRIMKGIPPYVWVINEHDESITVVVSKYRPNRLLIAGGLSKFSTGAGFNFETTV